MSRLIVVDDQHDCECSNDIVLYWNRLSVPPGCYSINKIIDENIEQLKDEYLRWIHDIGSKSFYGESVRDILNINGKMSHWWLSSIAEKAPMANQNISLIFKLRALELFADSADIDSVVFLSNDRNINEIISDWCKRTGLSYNWEGDKNRKKINLRSLFANTPHVARAFIYLLRIFLYKYHKVNHVDRDDMLLGKQAMIMSYYPNIDLNALGSGKFRTRYWEGLHDIIDERDEKINWILMFEPNPNYSFQQAYAVAKKLEEESNETRRFFFLEEFLQLSMLLELISAWFKLQVIYLRLSNIRHEFRLEGSAVNFWMILKDEWKSSLVGSTAMHGLVADKAFSRIAAVLPKQNFGLYLWENQSWEHALVTSWRMNQYNSPIIGVQHATIRYLNLRSFEDKRFYMLAPNPAITPDLVAVNGNVAYRFLVNSGYPEEKIRKVEALRFMYLNKNIEAFKTHTMPDSSAKERILLVVLPYKFGEASDLLELLSRTIDSKVQFEAWEILVKPHPNTPVDHLVGDLFRTHHISITNQPLSELWEQILCVFCANSTSVALEAALLKIPLAIMESANNLNLSILYKTAKVDFVSNEEELEAFLIKPMLVDITGDFFYLDTSMPKWRALLSELDEHAVS